MNTLETVLAMIVKSKPKNVEWEHLIPAFTFKPASILSIQTGFIQIGAKVDLTVFNPSKNWVYNKSRSKSTNSPLFNQTLTGKVLAVYVKDQIHYN
jgi:dihydroorotase